MKETNATPLSRYKVALYGPLKALSEQEAEKWFPEADTRYSAGIDCGPAR